MKNSNSLRAEQEEKRNSSFFSQCAFSGCELGEEKKKRRKKKKEKKKKKTNALSIMPCFVSMSIRECLFPLCCAETCEKRKKMEIRRNIDKR